MSDIKRYRKRPVAVEAMQLAGTAADCAKVTDWLEENGCPLLVGDYTEPDTLRYRGQAPSDNSRPDKGIYIDPATGALMIRTLEGDMRASYGDWIIRGVEGEFYPIKPGIFEATYEALEADGDE